VISIGDVVKAIISEKQSLIDQLHDYISGKFGSHVRHGNPGRVRSAFGPPPPPLPLASLGLAIPSRDGAPRRGRAEARGVGRWAVRPEGPAAPTRNYFPALPRTSP